MTRSVCRRGAIGSAAAFATIAAIGATGLATFALGPLFLAVLVGVGVGMGLDSVDSTFQLTQRLIQTMDLALKGLDQKVGNFARQSVRWHERGPESVLQFWSRMFSP